MKKVSSNTVGGEINSRDDLVEQGKIESKWIWSKQKTTHTHRYYYYHHFSNKKSEAGKLDLLNMFQALNNTSWNSPTWSKSVNCNRASK